jgi:hypothetical protein
MRDTRDDPTQLHHLARGSVPHRRRPCVECPWRRDTPPGQFDADRYTALADTTGTPGAEAHLFAPMFACHKSPEGAEQACAGWLAAVGYYHLGVRLAIATGRLDPRVLQPAPNWPPLFGTYQEMATTQARPAGQPANPPAPPNPVPSTDLEVGPTHSHRTH